MIFKQKFVAVQFRRPGRLGHEELHRRQEPTGVIGIGLRPRDDQAAHGAGAVRPGLESHLESLTCRQEEGSQVEESHHTLAWGCLSLSQPWPST